MAKVGFWLQKANGKLAGTTIYQSNGETVMREINTNPKNADTDSQRLQRVVMLTVQQAYAKMKSICDHSFEGQSGKSKNMAYFISQNVSFARSKIAEQQLLGVDAYNMYNYVPYGKKGFTPNQYQVSMGSLPRIYANIDSADGQHNLPFISGLAANTYQGVIDAFGLQRGDQLTFLVVRPNSAAGEFGMNEFVYCRVILDPLNADGSSAPLSTPFIVGGAINLPSVRNEVSSNWTFSYNNGRIEYKAGLAGQGTDYSIATAVIVSRKSSDDKWLRSTAYLTYVPNYGIYYSLGEAMEAASGVADTIYTSASEYLNNAGTGGNNPVSTEVDPEEVAEPAITAVKAAGVTLISGTQGSVILAAGTELPVSKNIVVTAQNVAGSGKFAVLKAGDSVAQGVAFGDNSQVTISQSVNSNIIYSIGIADDAAGTNFASSGFSFNVSVAASGGGNSDEDE